ncbi:hypothetical protein F511_15974 [Dorcoceras hygrometricum]|uniref:Uncharacterized protein n=1 Tax=Dorcoceras hygrometricum TaxID=472368 RepID=A0A2Z7BPT4_9LAMI|nr:hypothetical protein F511_15974 [Dorcoceras hygrometricum]
MATPAHFLMQDQNLNILHNGGKTDVTKVDKKGRVSDRKALNDISNSRKPSVFHSNKTENVKIAVSAGKDLCAASTTATTQKRGKATEKGKDGGRKALGDITNSVKRPLQQYAPKAGRKLSIVAEEKVPISIVDEAFLHNHEECIKAQTKIELDLFMKSVGLDNDISVKQSAIVKSSLKKPEELFKEMIMEEMNEHPSDNQFQEFWKTEISGSCSPACRSPESPKLPYMRSREEIFSDLMLIKTPKRMHTYP